MKLTKRKGFNFFRSYYDVYNELESDSDKVAFIDALLDRQFLGVKPDNLKGMAKFAYISQTNSIDTQLKGYEDRLKALNKNNPNFDPWQGVEKTILTPPQQVQEKEKEKEQVQEKGERVYSKEVHDTFKSCLDYFDIHLHPKKEETWLDVIDKLNRIDKIPFKKIIEIVRGTRADSFWSKNFLSLTKLRKTNGDGVKYIVVFNENLKKDGTKKSRSTGTIADQYEQWKNKRTH